MGATKSFGLFWLAVVCVVSIWCTAFVSGYAAKSTTGVQELTFMENDPNCNEVCSDTEPHPICVQLKSDRSIKKNVYNECILERVNCHYKNAYLKIHDYACP